MLGVELSVIFVFLKKYDLHMYVKNKYLVNIYMMNYFVVLMNEQE